MKLMQYVQQMGNIFISSATVLEEKVDLIFIAWNLMETGNGTA
jgi:hypothetical protein